MSGWSRRSVLAALGLAPLASACAPRQRSSGVGAIPQSLAATRVRLRELVSSMQTRFPYAAAVPSCDDMTARRPTASKAWSSAVSTRS